MIFLSKKRSLKQKLYIILEIQVISNTQIELTAIIMLKKSMIWRMLKILIKTLMKQ